MMKVLLQPFFANYGSHEKKIPPRSKLIFHFCHIIYTFVEKVREKTLTFG